CPAEGLVCGVFQSPDQRCAVQQRPGPSEKVSGGESEMDDYSSIAKTLPASLKLRVPPVAVCFTDKPPDIVPATTQPAAAGCVFWERGAQTAFVTSPADHSNCVVGMYTHHMPLTTAAQHENLDDCLKVFGDL